MVVAAILRRRLPLPWLPLATARSPRSALALFVCARPPHLWRRGSCLVLPYMVVFDGILVRALFIPFARGFVGVFDGRC